MKLDRKIAQKSQRYFMTGVSLITSNGSQGQNVMAAEWTMQVSYEPMLIAVFIHCIDPLWNPTGSNSTCLRRSS